MDGYSIHNGSGTETQLFRIEEDFDEPLFHRWISENPTISLVACFMYIVFIASGRLYMKDKPRFELRVPLALWSGMLALFSIVGTARVLPYILAEFREEGLYYTICNNSFYFEKPVNLWSCLFTLSKLIELGDTVFIVLRKQNLMFLHYYHHVTVLLYVWFSYPLRIGGGRWFMLMNYVVHSLMYTYYTLKALKVRVPKHVNILITFLQLYQMVLGVGVNVYSAVMLYTGRSCSTTWTNVNFSLAMYASYFILFAKFFYEAYIVPKKGDSLLNGKLSTTTTKDKLQ